jgi:hypothetical protein
MLKRAFWVAGIVATVALAVVVIRLVANPLRQPDDKIRDSLLALTPLGAPSREVKAFLDSRGWHDEGWQATDPSLAQKPFLGGVIGGYQGFPWYVDVLAFWEFNAEDRLTDIRIHRIYDSP